MFHKYLLTSKITISNSSLCNSIRDIIAIVSIFRITFIYTRERTFTTLMKLYLPIVVLVHYREEEPFQFLMLRRR